jgi:hypothetical protein
MPEGAAYVGRPSRWGNPWRVGPEIDPHSAVALYRFDLMDHQEYDAEAFARWLAPLSGRDLACWCPLDQPCHADVLLELANR